MKKSVCYLLVFVAFMMLHSCTGCSSTSTSSSSRYDYDDNYWKSVNREQALKDAGLDGAANIERKARLDYMQGGGYTSPDGGKQVHYQGSKEQQEHLRMMDEMGW